MLSVGPEELAVFGGLLLFLLIFGPGKFSSTARDLGQLLSGTKRTVEEAKSDLIPEKVKETRDAIKDLKSEALYGPQRDKERRKP
jgi:Sec-independent protein translocase protein TatA